MRNTRRISSKMIRLLINTFNKRYKHYFRKTKSKKKFVYIIQDDPMMARLNAEAIRNNQKLVPCSEHVVIPVYGISFDESLSSRFPTKLKQLQLIIRYIRAEIILKSDLRKRLSVFMANDELVKCTFPSSKLWIGCLIKAFISHLHKDQKYLQKIKGDDMKTFKIRDIVVGDLVIDTYLRFKPSPLFDINDCFVHNILTRADALILFYSKIFKDTKKLCVFTSFTTYIQNGIPAKMVYRRKAQLITLGSSRCLYRIHDTEKIDPFISAHPDHSLFEKSITLPIQQEQKYLQDSHKILEKRLHGKYDNSMSYMMEINIANDEKSVSLNKTNIKSDSTVLMLHAFNDAVHIYRWFLFTDFWEWANNTIQHCINQRHVIYIKPHPNTDPISNLAITLLRDNYRDNYYVRWVPKELPNAYIFQQNPKLIVTGYGSVALEAAYAGLAVLVAGDYAGVNLNLAMTAKSKERYFYFLDNPEKIEKAELRDNAIRVCALLKYSEGMPQLMTLFNKTRKQLYDVELLKSQEVNIYLEKAFKELSKNLLIYFS